MSDVPQPPLIVFLSIDELAWEVLKHVRVPDFLRLRRVNHFLKDLVKRAWPRRFSITTSLSYYFNTPDAFRKLQAHTGAVISGSFALNFFLPYARGHPDLDVYVSFEAAEAVGRWLFANGFEFNPFGARFHSTNHVNLIQAPAYGSDVAAFVNAVRRLRHQNVAQNFYIRGVMGVFEFAKLVDGQARKVELVAVRRSPMETILDFNSTCAMNFITFEKAYCLYPSATLDRALNLVLKRTSLRINEILRRYQDAGFINIRLLSRAVADIFRDDRVRWVHDQYSFVVDLSPNDRLKTTSSSPLAATTWSLSLNPGSHHFVNRVEMRMSRLYPIFGASEEVENCMAELLRKYREARLLGKGYHSVTGFDAATQLIMKGMILWLKTSPFPHGTVFMFVPK